MLYLKTANAEDVTKEWMFVRDMPEDENGFTNSWHGVTEEDFRTKALPGMIAAEKGEGLPEGYVPETIYFLWNDDVIVGQFRVRHYLCESLRTGAGHIGYYIAPGLRGRGYGTEGLRLTLEKAREIVPEDEFYLRLQSCNAPSLKVMLKNGGRVVSSDDTHTYVRIPNPGRAITYRVMETGDYDKIYDLWINTPGMGLNTTDDSREGIAKYLKRNPTTSFVALDGEKLVGVIMAGHDGRRGFIHHTAVRTEYRGRGIGRMLAEHAMEALDKEGINKAALVVFGRNETGNGFWEKMGFTTREDLVYRNKNIHALERIDT